MWVYLFAAHRDCSFFARVSFLVPSSIDETLVARFRPWTKLLDRSVSPLALLCGDLRASVEMVRLSSFGRLLACGSHDKEVAQRTGCQAIISSNEEP